MISIDMPMPESCKDCVLYCTISAKERNKQHLSPQNKFKINLDTRRHPSCPLIERERTTVESRAVYVQGYITRENCKNCEKDFTNAEEYKYSFCPNCGEEIERGT